MSNKKQVSPVIANAVIWAAIILATSLLTGDVLESDKSFMLLILQIAGWFATNGLVSSISKATKA